MTIKKNKNKYRPDAESILDDVPGMVYRCHEDADLTLHFASAGSYNLTGYTPEELVGEAPHWKTLTHSADQHDVWHSVQRAIQQGTSFELTYRIVTKENKEKWVREQGRAIGSDSGGLIVDGLISDITPLRRQQNAAQHIEDLAEVVVQDASDGIVMIDEVGVIQAMNPAAEQMFDVDSTAMIGSSVYDYVTTGDLLALEAELESKRQTSRPQRFNDGLELIGRRRGGARFPMHLAVRRVPMDDDASLYAVVIRDFSPAAHTLVSVGGNLNSDDNSEVTVTNVADVTQEAHVESVLKKDTEQQMAQFERLSMLGEMSAGIAHEINQPLTAISAYAQSALRFMNAESPKPEKIEEALGKLICQVHRAGAVVEQIRNVARQWPGERTVFDCSELLESLCDIAEEPLQARGVVIRQELARDLPAVLGDPVQVQQAVLNLLYNAAEAMERVAFEGGCEIVMGTRRTKDNHVEISVRDSGPGVSDAIAKRLFKPFSTDKASGLGMGLSISRSVAKSHGGQVVYVNNQTGGSTFSLILPAAQGETAE